MSARKYRHVSALRALTGPLRSLPWGLPNAPAQDPISARPSREVPNAQGWGCPGAPRCSGLGQWDRPGLPGPALLPSHGDP